MPVTVEYNNIRRMSTFTAPFYDISFDAYDFQLCQPQTDFKDGFESRDLEASYCRDFSCCGLILNDLHDLLQHYEECHVPLDESSELYGDDDDNDIELEGSIESKFSNTPLDDQLHQQHGNNDYDDDKELVSFASSQDLDISHLKKKAALYLMNLCQQDTFTDDGDRSDEKISCGDDFGSVRKEVETLQQQQQQQTTTSITTEKKRKFGQSNAMDLTTQTAVKKLVLTTDMISSSQTCDIAVASDGGDSDGDSDGDTMLGLPCFTSNAFLAHAGVLLASSTYHAIQHADKPYKCAVQGCSKSYKNPNGLKYHNQHGHCNLVTDEIENVASRPYQCTIGNCGKRYKNLNGLKYHIEHSHMAALNHTLATFGSAFFQHNQHCLPCQPTTSSSSLSTPSLSPSSSPKLSCLSPNF
ncbi:hypothetical protein BCR42DRAFT_401225 [Absidia repens]|uniref:C2H2-type domain-containing protein n=1 Tax=Absidia repens TaxID=90262 RepID=A0A1X2J244_9FUNG|nr:hypothetical protein BCR42DRAFT_401225 [Absidia repens]